MRTRVDFGLLYQKSSSINQSDPCKNEFKCINQLIERVLGLLDSGGKRDQEQLVSARSKIAQKGIKSTAS